MTKTNGRRVLSGVTRSTALLVAIALSWALPATAQPRPPHDALEAPLRSLTARDLTRLSPLMDQGVAGLVEHDAPPLLPGIHFAVRVHAPAETVADLLSHPEGYPAYMPALSEVTVQERRGATVAYHWQWQTSVFSLGGQAMLTCFSPPPAQQRRGWRVVVARTDGDLGHGREVWRVRPDGPTHSTLTLATRMDLTDANYVTRQMSGATRSLSRSITMTLGLGMVLRLRAEAERRAGHEPRRLAQELRRPTIDLDPLEPLLSRGDLLLIEAAGTQLRQTTVMTRYTRREEQVRSIMLDPIAFSEALIQGSTARLTGRPSPDSLEFEWRYDVPLVGASGTMVLGEADDGTIELDATGGAMNGGRWRFETRRLPSGATGVLGWASFDVSEGNFLLAAIMDADRSFAAGLSASTEVMMARAVRIRVDRMREDEDHVPAVFEPPGGD